MSRTARWAVRIAGYAVLALVTFVIALHLTFPYHRIRDRALETLSAKYDVTIGGVERSWVPGRFKLTAVRLQSRPAVVGQSVTMMYFKEVEIDLAFAPLVSGKVEIGLDVSTGAGKITGAVTQQKSETAFDFKLDRVPLTMIPGISDAVGLPMDGNANGKVRLKLAKNDWSKASGVFELACVANCKVGDGKAKIYPKSNRPGDQAWAKDGVAVPPLNIQRFELAIDIAKGEAKKRKFQLVSTDGEVDVDVNIKLAREIKDSTITGCIKYKCSKALYDREPNFRVTCDFGSPKVDSEGFHHIKLLGRLTNVRRIGDFCDGQTDKNGDPLSTTDSRPSLDLPPEPIRLLDAGVPDPDASVAPPPVEGFVPPPVLSRPQPKDDVAPPTAEELRAVPAQPDPPVPPVPSPAPTPGTPPPVVGGEPAQPEGGDPTPSPGMNGTIRGGETADPPKPIQ